MKLENSTENFAVSRKSPGGAPLVGENKTMAARTARAKPRFEKAPRDAAAPAAAERKWNLRKFAVGVGVWGLLGLLFTPQTYLVNLPTPNPLTFWQAFVSTMFPMMTWAILTPPIFRLCERFPLANRHFLKHVLLHLLFSVPFSFLHFYLLEFGEHLLLPWAQGYVPPMPPLALIVQFLANNVMFYWGIVAVNHAVNYFQKYQDREFRLVEARMQALKTQLNPHFLFNTLNAISELVYTSPANADKTISELSDLLRVALENDTAQQVALKDELEFLEKYLNIQQTLLDNRLKIKISVAPEVYDALVPNMILQPLAENAIRHGLTPRAAGGKFVLCAERKGDDLELVVRDDGIGFVSNWEIKGGIGLTNTRARLKHLYGDDHRFDVRAPESGGAEIRITIPFSE